MPPAKDARAEHLRKNRVSVRDLLSHTMERVPAAIDALLSRPDPLTEDEALDVYAEISSILLKAQEALQGGDKTAFVACMRLLVAGFDQDPGIRARGVECFATAVVLQALDNIVLHVVDGAELRGDDQCDFDALQVLLDVMDCACEGTVASKEAVGAMCMPSLAKLMTQPHLPFAVQRGVARCIIKLIVSCKANKARLDPWKFLGEAFVSSSDIYFQIQVSEIIFRLCREKKALLSGLGLPERTAKAFKALPNSAKLMELIVELVEDFNDSREPRLTLCFSAANFTVGGTTCVYESCKAYFDPEHLTVLADATSQPVTIPYTAVRSVRSSKDHRLVLRLAEAPDAVAHLLTIDEKAGAGADSVALQLSPANMAAFKESAIHQWILAALKRKKHEAEAAKARAAIFASGADGPSPSSAKRGRSDSPPAGPSGAPTLPATAGELASESPVSALAPPSVSRSVRSRQAAEAAEAAAASSPDALATKRKRTGDFATPQRSPQLGESGLQLSIDKEIARPKSTSHNSAAPAAANEALTPAPAAPLALPPPPPPAARTSSRVSSAEAQLLDTLMQQLRSVIEEKVHKKRDEAVEVLAEQMRRIQSQVDRAREQLADGLAGYEHHVRTELANLRHVEEQVREATVAAVEQLNGSLLDVKATSQAARDQLSLLDIDFEQVIDGARAAEDAHLKELKGTVETRMRELEVRMNSLAEAAAVTSSSHGSGNAVTSFLRSKASAGAATTSTTPGDSSSLGAGLFGGMMKPDPIRHGSAAAQGGSRQPSRSIPALQLPF